MTRSEQINELAAALAKAQGAMETAKKDSNNPFFKSRYADLASVVAAIQAPFADNGLAYTQLTEPCEGDAVAVETVLMHASGQWISSKTVVPVTKQDAQGYGSAITYARRYGLQAIAGLAAEDDDGNAAAASRKKAATPEEMMPKATAPREPITPDVGTAGEWAHVFTIAGTTYHSKGMTEAQYLESVALVLKVTQRRGKGAARKILVDEFKVENRLDLSPDDADKYLIRLREEAGDE